MGFTFLLKGQCHRLRMSLAHNKNAPKLSEIARSLLCAIALERCTAMSEAV